METEFEEVTLENFGPFVGRHKFNLSRDGTLTFVKGRNLAEPRLGPNGAGKSKLLNSIVWCLYGKTTDDLLTPDIRPWLSKDRTAVTVTLTSWDGSEGLHHTITRTAAPNALTLDGKRCSQDDIENLVGMPLSVFRLAPFLGQGQPLFHDLPNDKKLQFLVEVLGLHRWDEYSDRAKAKTVGLSSKLDYTSGEIKASLVRVEELKVQVARQKEEVDRWEEERIVQVEAAQKKLGDLNKHVNKLEGTYSKVSSLLDEVQLKLKLDQVSMRKLTEEAHKADIEYRNVMSRRAQIEQEHGRAQAQLTMLKRNRMCPTCGQQIKRESRYLENVEAIEDQIHKYSKELGSKTKDAAKADADRAKARTEAFEQTLGKLAAEADQLTGEEILQRRELDTAKVELAHAKRVCEEFATGANPHRPRFAELRTAAKKASDEAAELQEQYEALEIQLERTRYWVRGFKDVRLHVLEEALSELEFATNSMLDAIGLVGWEVRYAVERETKAGTIARGLMTTVLSPQQKGDVKWKSYSGGEGQRLRIAGALALSEVLLARAGVSCNLEVLDEPSQHMSSEGVSDLCEFLASRARMLKKSIYLIDHMAIESIYFDSTVVVEKTAQGSRIT